MTFQPYKTFQEAMRCDSVLYKGMRMRLPLETICVELANERKRLLERVEELELQNPSPVILEPLVKH